MEKNSKLSLCKFLSRYKFLFGFVAGLGLASFVISLIVPLTAKDDILARWVQVIPAEEKCWLSPNAPPDTQEGDSGKDCKVGLLARMVLPIDVECPMLRVEYAVGENGAGVEWNELNTHARASPDPDRYPVRVCELVLHNEKSIRNVEFPDRSLVSIPSAWRDRAKPNPKKFAIFGDTGCRGTDEQDCADTSDKGWPFARLAKQVKEISPDLIIHFGDFVYVGGDEWSIWQQQFFKPAREVLTAAPWIIVRGNHERCDGDAGRGWLFLFDYRPDGNMDTCATGEEPHLAATYALDFAKGHRLIVADTSTPYLELNQEMIKEFPKGLIGCENLKEPFKATCGRYKNIFSHVGRFASDAKKKDKEVWLVTHVPVFGTEEKDGKAVLPTPTAMMLVAWREANIPIKPDLLISGDRHLLQMVEVNGELLQLSAGTGGVKLDPEPPGGIQMPLGENNKSEIWRVCSHEQFGYLLAEPKDSGFAFSFHPLKTGREKPGAGNCGGMLEELNNRASGS